MGDIHACPLCCFDSGTRLTTKPAPGGSYLHCPRCDLIYATPAGILPPDQERERYLLHNNTPENRGYVEFLTGFLEEAVLPFSSGGRALEFGSGPGPVLAGLLEDRGFRVSVYDPFFYPRESLLEERYHLITATEVMEHVSRARQTWRLLEELLLPGGVLAVMTHFHPGPQAFAQWWYHRDPTHIRFYSSRTLEWICHHMNLEILREDGFRTVTLKKPR